jgi:hypothetical protein
MANIKNKQIDILKAYEDSLKDPHRYDKIRMYAIPIAIVALTAVTTGSLAVVNHVIDTKIADQDSQIKTTKDAIAASDKQSYTDLKTMTQQVSSLTQIDTQLKNQIKFSGSTLTKLDDIASNYDITYTGVTYSKSGTSSSTSSTSSSSSSGSTTSSASTTGDTVTITGSGETPDDIEDYVQELRETTKSYTNIIYTGYTASTTSTTSTTQAPGDDSTSSTNARESSGEKETTGVVQGESADASRSGEKTSSASSKTSTEETSSSSSQKSATGTKSSTSTLTMASPSSSTKSASETSSSKSSAHTSQEASPATSASDSSSTSTTDSSSETTQSSTTTTKTVYNFTVIFTLKK